MRRSLFWCVGALWVSPVCACSNADQGPGSTVEQAKGGGGSGGLAGSLSLGLPDGGGGSGGAGGGAGGAGIAGRGGASGGGAGTGQGGSAQVAGSSHGGNASSGGGSMTLGVCKRASASDADCADFYPAEPPDPAMPQAYTCGDLVSFLDLKAAHNNQCASVSFVTGAAVGACCAP